MDTKHLIWIGAIIGGTVGGFIPALWGGSSFSFSGIIFNSIGAILGIYIMFKITR